MNDNLKKNHPSAPDPADIEAEKTLTETQNYSGGDVLLNAQIETSDEILSVEEELKPAAITENENNDVNQE